MSQCRVNFSLTIFIIFFIYFQQQPLTVHGARVRCDSECLENKLDEVLERLKTLTETLTTVPDIDTFIGNTKPTAQAAEKPQQAESTQQRRRNAHNTHSIRSITAANSAAGTDTTSTTTNSDGSSIGIIGNKCSERLARICQKAGVSEIQLDDTKILPFTVLCDAERWIVVLQRLDGSVAFHNRTFDMYKKGFGSIGEKTEFFLGLQHLHELTFNGFFELRIDMEDHENVHKFAHYSDFSIFNEQSAYKMGILGVYHGTAGDSFMYHEGQQFSAVDRDNDAKSQGSCSEQYNSPGWFKNCMQANIFGKYLNGETDKSKEGMYWEAFRGPQYSLKSIKMSIRAKC